MNLILDEDFRDSVPKAKSTDSALPDDIMDLIKKLTEGLMDSSTEMTG